MRHFPMNPKAYPYNRWYTCATTGRLVPDMEVVWNRERWIHPDQVDALGYKEVVYDVPPPVEFVREPRVDIGGF